MKVPRSTPSDAAVRLVVFLPARDHAIFTDARRLLRRIMRDETPDLRTLIETKLRNHDSIGLAEDYLDFVAWPLAERIAFLPEDRVRSPKARARSRSTSRRVSAPPRDLTRN